MIHILFISSCYVEGRQAMQCQQSPHESCSRLVYSTPNKKYRAAGDHTDRVQCSHTRASAVFHTRNWLLVSQHSAGIRLTCGHIVTQKVCATSLLNLEALT